jgi:hypothetical protein
MKLFQKILPSYFPESLLHLWLLLGLIICSLVPFFISHWFRAILVSISLVHSGVLISGPFLLVNEKYRHSANSFAGLAMWALAGIGQMFVLFAIATSYFGFFLSVVFWTMLLLGAFAHFAIFFDSSDKSANMSPSVFWVCCSCLSILRNSPARSWADAIWLLIDAV